MNKARTSAGMVVFALVLGACGGGSDDAADSSTATPGVGGPTYSTEAFVVPFDVTVPGWLPSEVSTDASNFVTWEPDSREDPAVRFLVPVNVYPPGGTGATPPPENFVAYLLSQSEFGTSFTDTTETTVGGKPATLVTATAEDSLNGSLGCPAEDLSAEEECFGLQPDLALRIAVVDVGGSPLLIWLRHAGGGDTEDATREFAAFEQMLGTVRFSDEKSP